MSILSTLFASKARLAEPMATPQLLSVAATRESSAAAGPLLLSSSEERVALLELFTSEGCSSCPPADDWYRQLRARTDLWTRFVPVCFAVDYWNRLGWTDSLSSAAFTARQHRYAQEWDTSRVYTPEFVLNGREWRRPSKLADPRRPLDTTTAPRVGKLVAERTGSRQFTVTFTPTSTQHAKLRLTAALLGNGVEHRVTSGENSGRRLVHDFAVLSVVEDRMRQSKVGSSTSSYTSTVEWPASNQQGATSLSVAFWVSSVDSQQPIQSVGGDLL